MPRDRELGPGLPVPLAAGAGRGGGGREGGGVGWLEGFDSQVGRCCLRGVMGRVGCLVLRGARDQPVAGDSLHIRVSIIVGCWPGARCGGGEGERGMAGGSLTVLAKRGEWAAWGFSKA